MANGSYSAGNLEFVTQQISEKTLSSLDTLIKKLQVTMDLLGKTSSFSKNLGATIGRKSSSGSFSSNKYINGQLSSVTNTTKMGKAYEKISQVFDKQGKSIKRTIINVDEYGNKITKVFTDIEKQSKKTKSAFSLATLFNKVYFITNYTKQMFRNLVNVVGLAVDYAETLNLWQVAMRENRQEAEKFVESMNKAYGIATQTLMQYQAVFRNMLSSLGGINENVSYQLSEYLTQMALDYASLYNTSIERAMTTFQSVLSGQVRPIRSIAGYDITETTIYQLYQQLGGTKTMRQLTQTEKRLLRIYAVFNQMESSGAVNDLAKTMGSTANQMRIFTESTKELGTWLGITFEMYLKPILPYMNAFVITLTNIAKAYARMQGYRPVEYGAVESVQELNEALDETQGKLLSFDRFEALNSGEDDNNLLGIDEKLLAGLSQYSSILDGVTGKAQELAEKWTSWWVDAETGELTKQAQNLLDLLKSIGIVLVTLIGYKIGSKIVGLFQKITGLNTAIKLLKFALITGVVYSLIKAVEAFKEGDYWAGIIATTIGTVLVGAFIYLNREIIKTTATKIIAWFQNLQLQGALATTRMQKFSVVMGYVKVAIGSAVIAFGILDSVINSLDGTAKKTVSIISIIVGSLATLLGLILAIKGGLKGGLIGASIAGLGVGALVAGIKGVAKKNSDLSDITAYKTGGIVEDGIFTMNKKEMFGTFDDGTSVVANNMQITQGIENASYRGIARAMREYGGGGIGDVYLDGRKVGQTTARYSYRENVRTGLVKATN